MFGSQRTVVCRTCGGNRTVAVQQTKDGKTVTLKLPCPACGGSGQRGLVTK